jgi:hypothetical protein
MTMLKPASTLHWLGINMQLQPVGPELDEAGQ